MRVKTDSQSNRAILKKSQKIKVIVGGYNFFRNQLSPQNEKQNYRQISKSLSEMKPKPINKSQQNQQSRTLKMQIKGQIQDIINYNNEELNKWINSVKILKEKSRIVRLKSMNLSLKNQQNSLQKEQDKKISNFQISFQKNLKQKQIRRIRKYMQASVQRNFKLQNVFLSLKTNKCNIMQKKMKLNINSMRIKQSRTFKCVKNIKNINPYHQKSQQYSQY